MSTPKTERLRAKQIRIDGGTQMRVEIDQETVADYAEHLFDLPPIIVYFDGVIYWLADGFHRFHAHRTAGEGEALIDCEVVTGTLGDAILYAAQANKKHGLRRTNQDKRNAVEATLKARPGDWSDRKVAEWCGVSNGFVSSLVREKNPEVCTVHTSPPSDATESPLSQTSENSELANTDIDFDDLELVESPEMEEPIQDEQPAPDDDGSQPELVKPSYEEQVKARKRKIRFERKIRNEKLIEPFGECNLKLDAAISKLLGAHADIREALEFKDGAFRSRWAKARDMNGRLTLDYINGVVMHLRKERPAKIDANDSKGYKTVREIELLSDSKKAVAAGGAK